MIKRNFFTGLIFLFPLVITVMIVSFFINLLTKPFITFINSLFVHFGWFNQSYFFLHADQASLIVSKIFILISLILVTLLIGLLTQIVVTRYFIHLGERLLQHIPVINKIYKASKEVVQTVFKKDEQAFSQVVLVPFPHEKSYSIGMVTNESNGSDQRALISVFVPGTPNPTMGFVLQFRKSQLIYIDMKVNDAIKAIISCGVTLASLSEQPTEKNDT